ncbi:valacyclovir hydrolase-like protein, partial [Dinothrombium tinctorium]
INVKILSSLLLLQTMREGRIKVHDYNIYYEIHGDGENVILLLPGALGTIETEMRKIIELFSQEADLTVVAVDPPGYGKSMPPLKDFANHYRKDCDIFHNFMQKLGFKTYSLFGFSDGGRVGLIMAAKYVNEIKKVAVWATSAFITKSEKEYIKNILRDVSKWKQWKVAALEKVYGSQLQEYWGKFIDAYCEYDDIFTNDLKFIKCPVFILHGDKDPVIDKLHADYLAKNVTKAKVYHFPEGGHNIHDKYTEELCQLLITFVRENDCF